MFSRIGSKYLSAITVAVIIIIILFIYYLSNVNIDSYEKYFYGLWVADDDFCSDSNISSMLIFIGEPTCGWLGSVERSGYIIIQDDIACEQFTLKYSRGGGGPSIGKYSIVAKCEFESDDLFEGAAMTFCIDVIAGKMTISNGDQLFGKLYKQHDISNILAVS